MKEAFVFVYAKDGKIKVLSFDDAKIYHKLFLQDGWTHTKTLDACVYLQHLHNECKKSSLAAKIKSLSVRG